MYRSCCLLKLAKFWNKNFVVCPSRSTSPTLYTSTFWSLTLPVCKSFGILFHAIIDRNRPETYVQNFFLRVLFFEKKIEKFL